MDASIKTVLEHLEKGFSHMGDCFGGALAPHIESSVKVVGYSFRHLLEELEKERLGRLQRNEGPVATQLREQTRLLAATARAHGSDSHSNPASVIALLAPTLYPYSKSFLVDSVSPYFNIAAPLPATTGEEVHYSVAVGQGPYQNSQTEASSVVFKDGGAVFSFEDRRKSGCVVTTRLDVSRSGYFPYLTNHVARDELENTSYSGTEAHADPEFLRAQIRELMVKAGWLGTLYQDVEGNCTQTWFDDLVRAEFVDNPTPAELVAGSPFYWWAANRTSGRRQYLENLDSEGKRIWTFVTKVFDDESNYLTLTGTVEGVATLQHRISGSEESGVREVVEGREMVFSQFTSSRHTPTSKVVLRPGALRQLAAKFVQARKQYLAAYAEYLVESPSATLT